jgi:nitrite reductase/ring-hydroxylating ferredoxin subunit
VATVEKVGKVAEFAPGVMRPFRIGDLDIAVVNLDGAFHAFSNYCTHEAITFTSGYGLVSDRFVVCMMHSSVFDIATGEVVGGPASDSLETYRVHVEGEDVIVEVP